MSKQTLKRVHRQLCVGDLSKRIKIFDRSLQVPDFEEVDFTEDFTNGKEVWASVRTVSGQTIFVINQDVSFTHIFGIRFNPRVTSENWIRYNGINFDIINIQNLEERNEWLLLRCVATGAADLPAAQA